ncbi:hypothetical protein Y032_0068g174 [Ancylostoma ceylanicum]|uniref:Uncharacterized protein n=1 Tax=Ancylostoma ceylanicum TaxID=53326 RepID=A0A016TZR2_9BILA|nr:hypothetical protein Y032_0068g174 [Ancylostoma ceylanicum]
MNTGPPVKNLQFSVHVLWTMFLLPLGALVSYAVFVIVRRRKYRAKVNSVKVIRTFRLEPKLESSAELRKKNWTRKKRPMPPMYGEFDAKKFVDKGPLVLAKEFRGDVKFVEGLPSKEIVNVEYDERLNEVVEIGSGVEIYTDVGGYLSEYESKGYMVGILSAVRYLLDRNILHRDLKPGNILIGTDGHVKLADFGLAILKQDLNPMSVSGTPNYLAPEILMKRGHSECSEVWSLGCMLYCMLIGRPPFESESLDETYARIQAGQYSYPPWSKISDEARDLINACLIHTANFRPTVKEIQDDPWIKMNHPVPENALLRAKSMKDLSKQDANGNVISGRQPHRPKSTLDLASAAAVLNKSARKSIVSTHDSGFGSDPDMSRRPALAAAVNGYLNDIGALLGGACDFALEPCPLPPVFVSKWVDYTNRRGFGCQFSDGSVSVKFNEGLCLSWPANSSTIIYAQTPFSSPHAVHPAFLQNSGLTRTHIEVARQYREYMERELADTDLLMSQASRSMAMSTSHSPPYLVFTHLGSECLIMVFSDGTVQVNLMKKRSKIVLWNGDGGSADNGDSKFTCIAIIERGFAPFAYRIRPGHMYGLEVPQSLEDSLFVVRRALNMECDFLHVSRRPIQSTEC